LPANFLHLCVEAAERVCRGELDRWRNQATDAIPPMMSLAHFNGPDHYLDLSNWPITGDAANRADVALRFRGEASRLAPLIRKICAD
jgi:hypothetical protein